MFGPPHLRVGGEAVELQPLSMTLLAYLAVEGQKLRSHLAQLFWPHTEKGLNGLSSALSRIRQSLPGVIAASPTHVSVTVPSDWNALEQASREGRAEDVGAIYGGPFLAEHALRNLGLELEEWVYERRSRAAAIAEATLLHGAEKRRRAGAREDAAAYAERAYRIAIDGGFPSPEMLPSYHRHFAAVGHHLVAEIRSQAVDIGVELDPIDPSAAVAEHESSTAPTIHGFVEERRALRELCRPGTVTQVVGLGGSGKTTLARHLCDDPPATHRFAPATWVDFGAVTDPGLIDATAAAACGVKLAPDRSLAEELASNDARAGSPLMVLDNAAHLGVDLCAFAAGLADRADAAVVITTREPLPEIANTVRLPGLAAGADPDSPLQRLWRSAALRAGGEVDGGRDDAAAVAEIGRLVGGLPLAIELAASWTRVLSAEEIADLLRRSSELLRSRNRAQRSVDTIIKESFRRLDPEHQTSLELLAGFPAGVRAAEATTALGLSMYDLEELTARSMVVVDRLPGRLELHPLVAAYCRQVLGGDRDRDAAARLRRRAWCQTLLNELRDEIDAGRGERIVARLESELANVVAIWRNAIANDGPALVEAGVQVLREFFTLTGRLVEGETILSQAFAEHADVEPYPDLRVQLLEANAWFAFLTGRVPRAVARLADASAIVESGGVSEDTQALLLRLRGTMELVRGEFAAATATFRQALALTSPTSPHSLVSRLHIDLGNCYERQGEDAEARAAYRATLELGRAREDPYTVARAYLFLASLEEAVDPEHCLVLLDQARALLREHDFAHLRIYVPLLAGQAKLCLGDHLGGAEEFGEGLRLAEEIGQPMSIAAAHVGLGEALVRADRTAAVRHLSAGVGAAMATQCFPYVVWAAWVIADFLLEERHDDAVARGLLARSAAHPGLAPGIRPRAREAARIHEVDSRADEPEACTLLDGDTDQVGEQLLKLLRFR